MIFDTHHDARDHAASSDEAQDRLTPEQVEQRKRAAWSSRAAPPEAFDERHRLAAEGDSWFDYLPGVDVLDHLAEMGYAIRRVAKAGDTLENMVYGTTFDRNFSRLPSPLDQLLPRMREERARVLLFSGGGNDIAGPELEALLNHKDMGLGAIRTGHADHVLGTVVREAYGHLVRRVLAEVGRDSHVISHGYGDPIPDGRAVINLPGGWHFMGPWLRPALTKKNYLGDRERRDIVRDLVARFNATLRQLADSPELREHFHYVDVRPLIDDAGWVNELHLKNSYFGRVARAFDRVIGVVLGG